MSPDNPYVLKSYRYLRLVMVGLVVLLAASVLIELQQTGFGCWRTSISSYYWTPVRGVFVGALVAIGTCLIVLKGNTPVEDVGRTSSTMSGRSCSPGWSPSRSPGGWRVARGAAGSRAPTSSVCW